LSTVPYTFATASGNVPASQLDANFANVKASVDSAVVVTAEEQPNIRSVGTLTSLTVSGNVAATTFTGNFVGTVSNAVYANTANVATTAISAQTVTASTQLSITQVGTMTVLSVVGNIAGGNLRTVGSISATGNVTGLQFIGAGTGLTGIASGLAAGTVTTAAQPNITSVGTLTTLVSSGNITTTGGYFLGDGSQLTGIATDQAGANSLTGNTLSSNVLNSSLTSVGTLSILSVTGTITSGANISGNYFIGNGSQLTGVTSYTNANVTTFLSAFGSNTISTIGNVTSGNLITNNILIVNGDGIAIPTVIVNGGSNTVGNIGSSSKYFDTVFASATTALYADLAECYLADADYVPGTVLVFGGSAEVTQSSKDADSAVAGIVSTKPAYQMNSGLTGDHVVAVALVGRVPCQVKGPVKQGALMVATANGYARAESAPSAGTIIGKAVQSFDGDTGTIEVVVGRT
jgi:hypothetical protein